jgi:ribonuclease E
MSKQIIIAEQHRIAAVFSEDQIQELVVATGQHQVSDIYLGIVENVLPGIDAAFVNIGDAERNGFIHVSDLGPLKLKRNAGAITELLAPQQKVLVQIMKEPTGNKGPRLTGNLSLPGRYLVLMPSGKGVNLSRRIRDEDERSRLRALGILIKPAGMGLLVRTEAEGMAEEAIIEDLEILQKQWESIQQQAVSTRAPALLNRDDDFIQRVLRDVYSGDVNRIVVDSSTGLKRVKHYLMAWNGNRLPQGVLVDQHREGNSILEYFRVNAAIREALKPRVDLPSGGYIIIERTEALTVIDVNSGSFTRSATARETVLWTNCEAATEIARQLRLRNIAGVIIIDFIDMDARRDQLQVLEHFNKALKADKARPQIAQLTELGLVELTRKRQGQNIYELFGRPCAACGGLGHLAHLPGEALDAPGEMVERVPNLRTYESVGVSNSRMPVSSNQSPARLLDSADDLQELDLTNHPNYQDRGARRRRRGRRLGETLPRETAPPGKVLRQSGSGLANGPVLVLDGNGGAVSRKIEKTERTKPSRSESLKVREEMPQEVVSVSMTLEEQDVFAFMGISPLALYEGEIKNPRTAVIQVQLPGEESLNATSFEPEEVMELSDVSDGEIEIESAANHGARSKPIRNAASSKAAPMAALDELDMSLTPSSLELPTTEDNEHQGSEASQADLEESVSEARRRRRRSSAAATKAKQLSLGD